MCTCTTTYFCGEIKKLVFLVEHYLEPCSTNNNHSGILLSFRPHSENPKHLRATEFRGPYHTSLIEAGLRSHHDVKTIYV